MLKRHQASVLMQFLDNALTTTTPQSDSTARRHPALRWFAPSSRLPYYLLAILLVLASAGLRWALAPLLHHEAPLILFVLPVTITAWLGGFGPGLVATLCAAALGNYLFVEPRFHLFPTYVADNVRLALFVIEGIFISIIGHQLAGSLRRARETHTALQASQAQLRAANHDLADTLNAITDAFFSIDRNFRLTAINATAQRVLNLTPDRAIGRHLFDLFPEARDTRFHTEYQHALDTHQPTTFEAYYPPLDAWFEVRAFPSASGLAVYFQNINERKAAEKALQDSEARFRQLADSMPQLVWSARPDGTVDYYNQRVAEFEGIARNPDGTYTWQPTIHPDDTSPTVDAWQKAIATGATYQIEHRVKTAAGEFRWLLSRGFPIRDNHGHITRWFGTATDIHDLKTTQTALATASAAKDQFLAALSHELRTPLNPVLLTVTALEKDPSIPPALADDMAMIRRNIQLEARLIDDLLDLTRITRGKLPLNIETVDIHDLIHAAAAICREDLAAKSLRLVLHLNARIHTLSADAARIQQVLWNLLKNAAKFTPAHGTITITTSNKRSKIAITVSDTGVGIAPHLLPVIFEPFHQGSHEVTRHFGGLGLGLAISHRVATLHHGDLAAASPGPNQGATFTLTLPLNHAAPPKPAPIPLIAPPRAAARPRRILIIEDHPDTARTLARILAAEGHAVTTAHTLNDGIRYLTQLPFDLVLSDLGLPDGSGHDVARHLQQHAPHTPAVALSGFGMDADIRASLAAGFKAHLTKPLNPDYLHQLIQAL